MVHPKGEDGIMGQINTDSPDCRMNVTAIHLTPVTKSIFQGLSVEL